MTLAMFPVLVFMYLRFARRAAREAPAQFGDRYRAHLQRVPALVPQLPDRHAMSEPPGDGSR